jgi:hypothetical protein
MDADALRTIAAVVGATVGALGLIYGVVNQSRARGESTKRHEAEDKLRRYQTDPVVVPQGGGGSATRGADGHPSQMEAGVSVSNRGSAGAVALNVRMGIEKDGREAACPTPIGILGTDANDRRGMAVGVPRELLSLIDGDNPFSDINYWATYENRDGERFKTDYNGRTGEVHTRRL